MSERLGVGRQMISEAVRVMPVNVFLLEMVNVVKKQGDLQQDGLNYTFVKQQQEVGGATDSAEIMDNMESLLVSSHA